MKNRDADENRQYRLQIVKRNSTIAFLTELIGGRWVKSAKKKKKKKFYHKINDNIIISIIGIPKS